MIKKVIQSKNKNYICVISIGKKHLKDFKKYAYKNFVIYCKKNRIGLFLVTDHLIEKSSPFWKKPTWQKLIAPQIIKKKFKDVKNICMVDTDILINAYAPNIFEHHKTNSVSVVSVRKFMPYSWDESTKKIAFLRNRFYSKKYPLDSALNISLKNLYKFHKLPVQKDEFCAGVYVISKNVFKKFYDFFFNYKEIVKSITSGGEQTHFNYFIQKNFKINYLDYKFQALWIYEISNYYPFLYTKKYMNNKSLIANCISSSMMNNYFLHFAGTWHEGEMWKNNQINKLFDKKFKLEFSQYSKKKLRGKPIGRVSP